MIIEPAAPIRTPIPITPTIYARVVCEREEEGDEAAVLRRVAGRAVGGQVLGRLERGAKDAEELGDRLPRRRQQQEAHVEDVGAAVAGGVEGGGAGVVEETPRDGMVGVWLLLVVVGLGVPGVRQPRGAEEGGDGIEGPAVVVCAWIRGCGMCQATAREGLVGCDPPQCPCTWERRQQEGQGLEGREPVGVGVGAGDLVEFLCVPSLVG